MPASQTSSSKTAKAWSGTLPVLGSGIILFFFIVSGVLSVANIQTLSRDNDQITSTHHAIIALDKMLDRVRSAETSQRGYLLTDYDVYLKQYQKAVDEIEDTFIELSAAAASEPAMAAQLPAIHRHIEAKTAELNETIRLRQTKGSEAALALVQTDRGKNEMDAILDIAQSVRRDEAETRRQRIEEIHAAERNALAGEIATAVIGVLLCFAIAVLVRRAALRRQHLAWLQEGKAGLSTAVIGDQTATQIGESVLQFLCGYLDAQAGAFFVRNGATFERTALYGATAEDAAVLARFSLGEGLLGQAALEKRAFAVGDVPDGYLRIASALGRGRPRALALVPSVADHAVNAAFELGFLGTISPAAMELLAEIAEIVGIAVKSARYLTQQKDLLDETQRQAEELQVQSEELRVSNEELEEQTRALRESQAQLELQQAELHQTNAHLESQTQELAAQRDQLDMTRRDVEAKASALQQSSQYKSDFLANMSHELRTPLNSTLILAKLLADNPKGNLTGDQVKFARTIQSAGNDLLNLINDILDLSKIEAGHIEIVPEKTWLSDVADSMTRTFAPLAAEKSISFAVEIADNCPPYLVTDRLRLEQVIKNLAANGLKFTEKGGVTVAITPAPSGQMAFAVRDTGIGIAPEQQAAIFEAFRQADGTISRKFGGTGLGLSISRQLARLLGGRIDLISQPGEGSIFTLTIPTRLAPMQSTPMPIAQQPSATVVIPDAAEPRARMTVDDDRNQIRKDARLLLIVEDDEHFAAILRDLAHEMKFQCLVAGNAADGLALAARHAPNAIVLDVGLPDHSGLMVLDQIKHDPRTRHIPIHIVSGEDYALTARALGAIDFLQKPVQRDELAGALRKLESRIEQGVRRVLIVEDDPVQRDSVGQLLASRDVETVGVGTAADCLATLKDQSFDCIVLDLTLPDASGYQLLETLGRERAHALPPIIVYTGRELSAADEEQLRRYSRSIIIKGAKSPERLLDEVSLFLHQVVSDLSPEQRRMIEKAHNRDAVLEGRTILIVEDDIRNVYALTSIFEPLGAKLKIARNGVEGLNALNTEGGGTMPDLVLMDVMMPEMDGITATRKIRENPALRKLPIIMLTAKAMKDDQEKCLKAGANDYMAKPLDVDKLLSLVRVWMPR